MIFVNSSICAGFFLLLLIICPQLLVSKLPLALKYATFMGNLGLLGFVWYSTSSPEKSFFEGLEDISEVHMTGWAITSLIVIPFILFWVYLRALITSINALRQGRSCAQRWWIDYVYHRSAR